MEAVELIVLFLLIIPGTPLSPPKYSACNSKDFGHGGTVCVCTEKYCDGFSQGSALASGEYAVYTSSKTGARFHLETGKFNKTSFEETGRVVSLSVNSSAKFQEIVGFGGAFTGWLA